MGLNATEIIFAITAIVLSIISTSSYYILSKILSVYHIDSLSFSPTGLVHPWCIAYCYFIGKTLCLIPYIIILSTGLGREEIIPLESLVPEQSTNSISLPKCSWTSGNFATFLLSNKAACSYFLFVLPSTIEIISITMLIFALRLIDGYVCKVLSSVFVLFNVIINLSVFKSRFYSHRILGLVFVVIGVLIIITKELYDWDKMKVYGVALMIASGLLKSIVTNINEWIYQNYDVITIEIEGIVGLWGLLIYSFLLIAFQKTTCYDEFFCHKSNKIENILALINSFIHESIHYFLCYIFYILSVSFMTSIGAYTTRLITELYLLSTDIINTIIIMLIMIFYNHSPLHTLKQEQFDWLIFIGYSLCLIGYFILYEVIVIPCCNLSHNIYKKGNPFRLTKPFSQISFFNQIINSIQ